MAMVSHKFRVYPTAEQRAALEQWFGASRWVWNRCLEYRSKAYRRRGESRTGVDFSRLLTAMKKRPGLSWLALPPATIMVQKLRDQDAAFSGFFAGRAKYPRFKKREHGQVIRFQMDQRQVHRMFDVDAGLLKLPKLGRLKVRWSRKPGGVPKMVTLKKTADGRYFVTMMVEEARTPKAAVGRVVGIDLGIKDLIVTSHGEKLANLRPLKRLSWQLRRQQRRLSRQRKGSNRWHCQRRRVARLHARIADMRSDMAHKITRRLVNENQVIAIETLNVAGMMKNRRLARSISDAAFSEIVRQLRYKAAWDGRTLVEIDQWFPSSKRCSNCEHTLDELRLDQREWTCPKCGTHHDRDINAAINIEREGLKLLTPRGTGDVRVEGDTSASATAHAVTLAASVETRTRQSIGTCLERVTDD